MRNHENIPGTMKNQPETMKNHETTLKNHGNQPLPTSMIKKRYVTDTGPQQTF